MKLCAARADAKRPLQVDQVMGELDVQTPTPPLPAEQLKPASQHVEAEEEGDGKKKCKAKAKAPSKAKSKADKKRCAPRAAEEAARDEAPRTSPQVKAKAECPQVKPKKAKVDVGAPPPAGAAAESAAAVPTRPGVAQVYLKVGSAHNDAKAVQAAVNNVKGV